jgi:hypothetical protein
MPFRTFSGMLKNSSGFDLATLAHRNHPTGVVVSTVM